jgi:hypothetical protein
MLSRALWTASIAHRRHNDGVQAGEAGGPETPLMRA